MTNESPSYYCALARTEYHRSHVRFYRKHNGALLTAGLRLFLGAKASLGWLLALGPGPERRRRRREERDVLRIALAAERDPLD